MCANSFTGSFVMARCVRLALRHHPLLIIAQLPTGSPLSHPLSFILFFFSFFCSPATKGSESHLHEKECVKSIFASRLARCVASGFYCEMADAQLIEKYKFCLFLMVHTSPKKLRMSFELFSCEKKIGLAVDWKHITAARNIRWVSHSTIVLL